MPSSSLRFEAERLTAVLAQGRNVCDSGLAHLAARVANAGRWRPSGALTAAQHAGSLTGGSPGAANKLVGAGRDLLAAPETKKALGEGTLSLDQAAEISGAVSETATSANADVASTAAEV